MAEPRVSRPFIVIAGIGAVLVIALVGYKLLGSGGSDSSGTAANAPTTTLPSGAAGAGTESTTTTTVPAAPVTPNQSFDVFTTKNPFQPVVGIETGATDTGTPAMSTPTTPTTPTSGSSPTPSTPAAAVPADQAPSAGTAVALLDVSDVNGTPTARVQVGSTVYPVTPGATFATSYRLVTLSGSCGQFQYGDSPFQLCVGEQVLK